MSQIRLPWLTRKVCLHFCHALLVSDTPAADVQRLSSALDLSLSAVEAAVKAAPSLTASPKGSDCSQGDPRHARLGQHRWPLPGIIMPHVWAIARTACLTFP
eukprot:scaffold108283_cov18-Prasinocladus_malaysianus.AAC.1